MAHLEPEQLDQALQRLYPGVKLEVPGTAIDAKLLARILAAVTGEDGVPRLDCACFAMVHFTGNAKFANAQFSRDANFAAARFSGETNFDDAMFSGDALFTAVQFHKGHSVTFVAARFGRKAEFSDAKFGRDASFTDSLFAGKADFGDARFGEETSFVNTCFEWEAEFHHANFSGAARFSGTQFAGIADFDHAQFYGQTTFADAQFSDDARFYEAQFSRDTLFDGVRFRAEALFAGAQFSREAEFSNAHFEGTTSLGPLAAATLILKRAIFSRPVSIEAAAVRVICNGTTWESGVAMHLRYAQVDFRHALFSAPSFVEGANEPFALRSGSGSLDESNVRSKLRWERSILDSSWVPIVLSLKGTDESNFYHTRIDLSQYRRGFRLVLYILWTIVRGIGRALLKVLELIGRFVGSMAGKIAGVAAKYYLTIMGKWLLAWFLGLSSTAVLLGWARSGHHWFYAAAITVVFASLAITLFIRRGWVADEFSLPIRLRHSPNSGWYASHAHTEVGAYRTRWAAAYVLVMVRRRLREAETGLVCHRLKCPLSDPVVRWWRVERALNAWADFPVTCKVRPLVLLGSTILEARAPIDEDAQPTAQREFIRSVSGFPAVLLRAFQYRDMTDRHSGPPHDDVSAGVSALTEIPPRHGSFTQIEEAPEKPNGRPAAQDVESPMWSPPVASARRDTAEFVTDRGMRELPAWEIQMPGAQGRIWVLDPGVRPHVWNPSCLGDQMPSWGGGIAQLSPDGRTIALSFSVIAEEYIDYQRAEVLETNTAVAVIPVPVFAAYSAPLGTKEEPKRPYKQRFEVSVTLTRPLGQRVLLDGDGCPVLVNC